MEKRKGIIVSYNVEVARKRKKEKERETKERNVRRCAARRYWGKSSVLGFYASLVFVDFSVLVAFSPSLSERETMLIAQRRRICRVLSQFGLRKRGFFYFRSFFSRGASKLVGVPANRELLVISRRAIDWKTSESIREHAAAKEILRSLLTIDHVCSSGFKFLHRALLEPRKCVYSESGASFGEEKRMKNSQSKRFVRNESPKEIKKIYRVLSEV